MAISETLDWISLSGESPEWRTTVQKKILMRYDGTCKKCRTRIGKGSDAYWLGKGQGVTCFPACQTESAGKPAEISDNRVSFDFSELKSAYLDRNFKLSRKINRERLQHCREGWNQNSGFYGCSADEMDNYLNRGFPVAGLTGMEPDLLPKRQRRRMKFDEDGELQYDMALSGFDYPYLEWERRERKPGMRVDIGMDFNANVSAEIIGNYQRWVAQLLYTIEEIGYDLEVNLLIRTTRSWKPDDMKPWTVACRVKKENEASDFTQWSAALSPGGFRHLGFLSIILAGDRQGKDTNYGLGSAVASSWNVAFSRETRVLTISQGNDNSPFPEAAMTEKLTAALNEAKH